jgi:ABC-2 type transport system permease protein
MNVSFNSAQATVPPWPVVGALAQRELVRFFRQRNRVFGALGQPIIFWVLFSAGLQSNELGYAHFFPGTLVMILLFTAIFATISIIEDRREGFLQGVLVAPIPRWSMVLGKVLGGSAIAMLQGLLFLILGLLTVEQVSTDFFGFIATLVLMAVVSIALTALGADGLDAGVSCDHERVFVSDVAIVRGVLPARRGGRFGAHRAA